MTREPTSDPAPRPSASQRPAAASGRTGPDSARDRAVDLEIVLGEMGCGDLVWELRQQFSRAAAGSRVRVVTRDPGAPSDVPAWCRMTGHRLVESDAPYYLIEARTRDEGD